MIRTQKIQIWQYIFDLEISEEDGTIISSDFKVQGKLPAALSDDELRQGGIYQQEIFNGKWHWLMDKETDIVLPIHDIVVSVVGPQYTGPYRFGGGSISSNMKIVCEHCGSSDCDFDCIDALEWVSTADAMTCEEKRDELEGNLTFNKQCDALESMILAHAIAGLHVDGALYIEGIVSALDAMGNQ
jgi:hypothetical protein